MRKNLGSMTVLVVLAILLVTPSVMAQAASPAEVAQNYYAALSQAAVTGDTTPVLELFADDATVMIVGLSPQPVQGKEAMQATFGGMLAMLQGLTITMGDMSVDGDTATVTYTMSTAGAEGEVPVTDTFVVQDGKIQSLTMEIAPEALAATTAAEPAALPETGGAVGGLFPGLVVVAGAALVALGRRFSK
jgi:ketosteroid isomerase-like protein